MQTVSLFKVFSISKTYLKPVGLDLSSSAYTLFNSVTETILMSGKILCLSHRLITSCVSLIEPIPENFILLLPKVTASDVIML